MEPIRTRRYVRKTGDDLKDTTTLKTRKSFGKENCNNENNNTNIKEEIRNYMKVDVGDSKGLKAGGKDDEIDKKLKLRSGRSILGDKSNLISQNNKNYVDDEQTLDDIVVEINESQLKGRKDKRKIESKSKVSQNVKVNKKRARPWQTWRKTTEIYHDDDDDFNNDEFEDEELSNEIEENENKKKKIEHDDCARKTRSRKFEKIEKDKGDIKDQNETKDHSKCAPIQDDSNNSLSSSPGKALLEDFNSTTTTIDRVIKIVGSHFEKNCEVIEPFANVDKQTIEKLKQQNSHGIRPKINIKMENLPIDRPDRNDPLATTDYIDSMFQSWRRESCLIFPYLTNSRMAEFTPKMRAILVDWLVDVHIRFKLVPNTLYLCVQLIDRYCSKVTVERGRIQLVGITCLMIAGKFEDVYPPDVQDCVYITDNAYVEDDVLEMETDILKKLQYRIFKPTIYNFLLRLIKLIKLTKLGRWRAHYYAERCLQEHEMLEFTEIGIACAAVALAKMAESLDVWPADIEKYTGIELNKLEHIITLISKYIPEVTVTGSNRQLTAVKKKYANAKYMEVAEVGHPEYPAPIDEAFF